MATNKVSMFNGGKYQHFDCDKTYFYVGYCGSGRTVFAEEIEFVKETTQHLVWKTNNGRTFKTKDNGHGVGKASKVFILVRNAPLEFCDRAKGIATNYIRGVWF